MRLIFNIEYKAKEIEISFKISTFNYFYCPLSNLIQNFLLIFSLMLCIAYMHLYS